MSEFDTSINIPSKMVYSRSHATTEPEATRLQREIDHFTHKLEQERRKMIQYDEKIKRAQDELKARRLTADENALTPVQERRLEKQIPILEKKLQSEMAKLNTMQSDNRKMRERVDAARREKLSLQTNARRIDGRVNQTVRLRQERSLQSLRTSRVDQRQQKQMTMIRSKSSHERSMFKDRISELNSVIHQDRMQKSTQIRKIEETITAHLKKSPEAIMPTVVLRKLLEKWEEKVGEKKTELDTYLRQISTRRKGFTEIMNATGFSSIDDIVTTLIKSEDQNHSLRRYINNLSAQIDSFERKVSKLDHSFSLLMTDVEKFKNEDEALVGQTQTKLEWTTNKLVAIEAQTELIKQLMNDIKTPMSELLGAFKDLGLELNIAKEHDITDDEGYSMHESLILPLIAELEEYIYQLEIYLAYRNREKLAAAKPVPIDELPQKNFNEKPISIKAVLDQNLLLDDPELDEAKAPLPIDRFKEMAEEIAQNAENDVEFTPNYFNGQ